MTEVLLTVLKIIAIIAAILFFFFIMLIIGLSSFFKPNKISDSVAEIKQFLGVDFGEGYTVIDHLSQNGHPDRPLSVKLIVDENIFYRIKTYLESVQTKSEESVKGTSCETTTIEKNEKGFTKISEKSHVNSGGSRYRYYRSILDVNFESRIIEYSTSFY